MRVTLAPRVFVFDQLLPLVSVEPRAEDDCEHDKVLTRALVLALETIQMNALDRLIVSPDSVCRFRKEGLP